MSQETQETQETNQPTSASEWKKRSQTVGRDLPLPSGNVCRIRRISIDTFLRKGLIPNALMPIVQQSLQGQKPDEQAVMTALQDAGKLQEMFDLYDTVVLEVVLEPKVCPVPPREAIRDESLLYVDEVDFEDKIAIFEAAVSGVSVLQPFRAEEAPTVAVTPAGSDVRPASVESARGERLV